MEECEYGRLIDDYLLDRLNDKEKSAFEEHFFNCSFCSKELVLRERILETIRERGQNIFADIIFQTHSERKAFSLREVFYFFKVKRWAMASLILFILVFSSGLYYFYYKATHPSFLLPSEEVLRGELVVLISPQGELKESPSLFIWKKFKDSSEYIFSLYDSGENLIWERKTKSKRIRIPNEVKVLLKRGDFYFWEVKALSPQGSVVAQSRKAIFRII